MKGYALFLVLISSFAVTGLGRADTVAVTFGYQDSSNYPYQTGDGARINWEKPGVAVEHLQHVEKMMNIRIRFKRFPWKRGLVWLQEGNIDGLFSASYKPERTVFGAYPVKRGQVDQDRRSYYNTYYLYKIKGSPLSWDGKAFDNLKFGLSAVRGFSIVSDLKKMGILVHEFNNTTKCMNLLIQGRVDGVAALELAGDSIVSENQRRFERVTKVEPALKRKAYYLMLSHQFIEKHPDLSETIWHAIATVRESDVMKTIHKKYTQ